MNFQGEKPIHNKIFFSEIGSNRNLFMRHPGKKTRCFVQSDELVTLIQKYLYFVSVLLFQAKILSCIVSCGYFTIMSHSCPVKNMEHGKPLTSS